MKQIRQLLLAMFCVVYVLCVNGLVYAQNENLTNATETKDTNPTTQKSDSIATYTFPFTELSAMSNFPRHFGPVIQVKFDEDSRPVRLLLDTGAGLSLLRESFAKKRNLTVRPAKEISHRKEEFGIHKIWKSLEKKQFAVVEYVDYSDVLAMSSNLFLVYPDSAFFNSEVDRFFDGVLGLQRFGGLAIRLNYGTKQVVFYERGQFSPQEISDIGLGGSEVVALPMKYDRAGFFVRILIEGRERELLVDTGANRTLVSGSAKDFPNSSNEKIKTSGFNGQQYTGVCAETVLSFGDRAIAETQIGVVEKEKLPNDGVLGADVLSRFDVLMDFPGKKLYLKPLKKEAKKP